MAAQGGQKMLKKMRTVVVFSFAVSLFAVLSISLVSCSNNPLANSTWQDTAGIRTLTFTETTFRWIRKDENRDLMGTYTISKDAVVLSFDDGDRYTGVLISGVLSFTVNPGHRTEETHVEFHRVR
jgi:hypothetical protein